MKKSDIIVGRKYRHNKNTATYLGVGENVRGEFVNKNLVCLFERIIRFEGPRKIESISYKSAGKIVSEAAGFRCWSHFILVEEN